MKASAHGHSSGARNVGRPERLTRRPGTEKNWVRTVAAGTLVTGAILLASGRRKSGLAIAAAGTIFALVEDPEGVKKVWNNIPDYLDNGHNMLSRFEKFVGELTSQGEKLRSVVEKVVRQ